MCRVSFQLVGLSCFLPTRGFRHFPLGSTIFPWVPPLFPNNRFVTVHEAVYFGPTTEISQMSAAASPLLRAVVPRCPAPTGDRVAPRPENNRLLGRT